MKYLKVWWRLAQIRFKQLYLESRLDSIFLMSGKLVRFTFFLIFIVSLLSSTKELAGYSFYQTLLFFMTFNLVDITTQFLLRGTYNIQGMINNGSLDLFLTQPVNVLFRVFSDLIDLIDLATLVPVISILAVVILRLETPIGPEHLLFYLLLCVNGILIATSIHIFIIGMSTLTQEISSQIWIYRDLMTMGRFPVDIYSQTLQITLTFVVPIAVMVSFPAKVLLGVLQPSWIIGSFVIGLLFFAASLRFWRFALKNYTSIST